MMTTGSTPFETAIISALFRLNHTLRGIEFRLNELEHAVMAAGNMTCAIHEELFDADTNINLDAPDVVGDAHKALSMLHDTLRKK